MREILFKGQRVVNKKWVEGYLFKQFNASTGKDDCYIRSGDTDYLVIPETVGQSTGLIDKNNRKMFENDIVKLERGLMLNGEYAHCDVGKVIYDHCCFFVAFADGCRRTRLYREDDTERYEIIGNLYDNPELLKGGECYVI